MGKSPWNKASWELRWPAKSPLAVHLRQLVRCLGTTSCARLQFHSLQGHGHGFRGVQASKLRGVQGHDHRVRGVQGHDHRVRWVQGHVHGVRVSKLLGVQGWAARIMLALKKCFFYLKYDDTAVSNYHFVPQSVWMYIVQCTQYTYPCRSLRFSVRR